MDTDLKTWTCPICTLINAAENRNCNVCNHSTSISNDNNNNIKSHIKSAFSNLTKDVKGFLTNVINPNTAKSNENGDQVEEDVDVIEISPSRMKKKSSSEPKLFSNNFWVCKGCNYSTNPNWSLTCEVCLLRRGDEQTVIDLTKHTTQITEYTRVWSCFSCTFNNFDKDLICDLCKTPRRNNPANMPLKNNELKPRSANEWICMQCTFINDISKNTCHVCEHVREAAISQSSWSCEICSYKNDLQTKICIKCAFNGDDNLEHESQKSIAKHTNSHNHSIMSQRSRSTYTNYAAAAFDAEKNWNNILQYCSKNKSNFVDPSFPPCDKSLYIKNKTLHPKLKDNTVVWLRPDYIRTHQSEKNIKWSVYNEPKFSDIKQGLLGDCWLISGRILFVNKYF